MRGKYSMDSSDKIWRLYSQTKDSNLREKIILEYSGIIKFVAGRLSAHLGQHVEYQDMYSYGIFGLIDAIDKYDYTKGVKFETYASLRIRGAILDNIRKLDWVPRTLRIKNKQFEQVYSDLESQLGREPSEEELAEKLEVSLDEIKELVKKSSILSLVSLDDYLEQNHEAAISKANGTYAESPEALYEKQEAKQILTEAIEKLTDKERLVITSYYFEEMTLKEISVLMGVSESRVSQIHSKAVLKLRTKIGKFKSLLTV